MPTNEIFDQIRGWAKTRGLYESGDVKTQFVKLQEEAGEVARAIIKGNDKELKDGIGDMVVVLTNLAHLAGTSIEECTQLAWDEIKDRSGSMQNGSFVKKNRLVKCIGLVETKSVSWAWGFEVGKTYKLIKENLILEESMLVAGIDYQGNEVNLNVDKDQFEEVI